MELGSGCQGYSFAAFADDAGKRSGNIESVDGSLVVGNGSAAKNSPPALTLKSSGTLVEAETIQEKPMETKAMEMRTIEFGGLQFGVERYDGRADYILWERQVKTVLRAIGLGKLLKPKPNEVAMNDWEAVQDQAVGIIMLHLQPQVLKQLDDHVDCTSLFEALRQKYHRKELSSRLYKKFQLMRLKMDEETTKLQDHIDAFNDLVVDLHHLGEDVTDDWKSMYLLASLPEWRVSLALSFIGTKNFTYDEAVRYLLTEELHQKVFGTPRSPPARIASKENRGRALQLMNSRDKCRSRSRSTSRGRSQERKVIHCWKCGKTDHIKKDCPAI